MFRYLPLCGSGFNMQDVYCPLASACRQAKQTKTVAIGLAGKFASLFKYAEKYHMPSDLCAT